MSSTTPSTAAVSAYTIHAPQASYGVLRVTWCRPVTFDELVASYNAVLTHASQSSNCRHWLLDLSQRDWAGVAFWQWLGQEFAARATQVLGGPVYVAYLVAPHHLPGVRTICTGAARNRADTGSFYSFFCENAALASEWLRDQQGLEPVEVELPTYPIPLKGEAYLWRR